MNANGSRPSTRRTDMRVSDEQRAEYFEFASSMLGETFVHGPTTKCLTSLSDAGEVLGVVLYDRITDRDCMIHVASDSTRRWFGREMLFWTFWVPFEQYKVARVTGLVREDNDEALRFDRSLGFVEEGRVRQIFPGGYDGILLGMLREECRFLDTKFLRRG